MKKMLCSMLCFALFLTSASAAFATDGAIPSVKEDKSAELIEEVVKSGILEASKAAIVDLAMIQPKEIKAGKEAVMEGNSILPDRNTNVDISVSPLQKEEAGVSLIGNKTLVEIKNASAPKQYSFRYDLPNGYRMMKSEDYFYEQKKAADQDEEDLMLEQGWIYILDGNDEIVAVIDPAEATDADGNSVRTHYDLVGTSLVQVIDFDANTSFPVTATPTATRPTNHKIEDATESCTLDHNVIGLQSFVAGTGCTTLTAAAKTKIKNAIITKIGSKFVPILNIASWAVSGYATIASYAGYRYTKVTVGYEIWAYYKHQGGRWVEGRQYKNPNIKLKCIKE